MLFFGRKDIKKLSDVDLASRYRKTSDSKYMEVLFERYFHLVFGVCLKYLKNEFEAKESVLAIYERQLKEFKGQEIDNIPSWLHVVSRNYCFTYLRTKGRALNREKKYEAEIKNASLHEEVEDLEIKEVQLTKLETALDKLKEDQKACIELFYLQQLCYQDVAQKTGFNLKQVKSHIQNGKRNLKIILSQYNEFA